MLLFNMISGKAFFVPMLLFFLAGIFITFKEYHDTMARLKKEAKARIDNYENEKARLIEEIKTEEGHSFRLRNRESMIANLYEMTKKMSKDLTFDEIFDALSAFLKENFEFTKSELIILEESGGYIRVNKVYCLRKEDSPAEEDPDKDYGDIIAMFAKDKKGVYMPKADGSSLGAIPLLSENKFVGILTVENMPASDFERLSIVTMQFSLEMKKVLLYETVEALAITDSLTGLFTRRYFFERLTEELIRSKKHNLKLTFLMVDIDDFKKCNDTHGHLVGDVVLKEVSRLIRESVREIDLVARYGGEEFSLILPETDRKGALLVAERIRKKIEDNVFNAYDEKLKLTVSVGLSVYPEDADESEGLTEKADKAMYAAKNSGKNIVCEYKG
jgi:diguanylate cyclase (GGDEF)-like protein